MGERQPERTRYTLLPDPNDTERSGVHESAAGERTLFSFVILTHFVLYQTKQNFFRSRDRGQRGIKGVNGPWSHANILS